MNFIAMEYVEGESLSDKINGRPLPVSEIVSIGAQIADALDEAHAHGIVHRDIKSANVMLDGRGRVKVLDFGLAKITKKIESEDVTQVKTNPGVVMGTVSYMSPEQALGRETDVRTDIWSLGVILYEMATGRLPFASDSVTETIDKIAHAQPEAMARLNYEVPPELEVITKKALRKKREERYQSARDVLVDLENLRRELESTEHSFAPDLRSSERKASFGSEQPTQTLTQKRPLETDQATPIHTTSSAEYIATEIKRHKRGAMIVIALLVFIVAGIGYGIYRYSTNQKKTAPPVSAMKLTRLTTTGKATVAAISPDGRYVVYAVNDNGQQSLWMRQTATQSNVQIMPLAANVEYARLIFSPDGDYLFYVARENNAAPTLYQIPVLGGSPRKLLSNISNFMALSPDAAQIVFARNIPAEGIDALIISNLDGTAERRLVVRKLPKRYFRIEDSNLPASPAWSPDGKTIAFPVINEDTGKDDLVVVDVASGQEKLIDVQKLEKVGQLAWLGDGSGLLVLSGQLWQLSYPEGELRRITNDLNTYRSISLTADSNSLVTVQFEQTASAWIAPQTDIARAKQITRGTGRRDKHLAWTPDGKIVFDSNASGQRNIWIMNADGGNQKQLTMDGGCCSEVSPDGRYIAYQSGRSGNSHIYRMDTNLWC